jgi:hypothetical protein
MILRAPLAATFARHPPRWPRSPRSPGGDLACQAEECPDPSCLPAFGVMRKGGRRDALAINPETAARLRAYFDAAGHGADVDGNCPTLLPGGDGRSAALAVG